MASSLLDRFGLGNARAVANAGQDARRREVEDRLVADLVQALSRSGVVARLPVTPAAADTAQGNRAAA